MICLISSRQFFVNVGILIKSIISDLKIFPKVICVEQISLDCKKALETSIYKILSKNKYMLISKTMLSSIYVLRKFVEDNNTPYFDYNLSD